MLDLFKKRYHPPGTAPGTLAPPVGPLGGTASAAVVTIGHYAQGGEVPSLHSARLDDQPGAGEWLWVHLQGTPTPEQLRQLGERFDLHPLALEDVANTGQRPKTEFFDGYCALILNAPVRSEEFLQSQQLNLFIGPRWVVSIHEGPTDPFGPIRQRLHNPGKTRHFSRHGAAYLGYALMDLVVDQAFPILEELGGHIETLEEAVLEGPDRATQTRIHQLRREMLLLRRQLWPTREALARLLREGDGLFDGDVRPYFRDVHDHVIHIMDLLESYREMTASLVDAYLTGVNHRLNEVMKVLTVIATIFIPLTFLVGVYGMNFEHPESPWAMPELAAYYGYPLVWLLMIAVAGGMLYAFRRRGWF